MVAEEALRSKYREWRRTLHKAKDFRVKVLRAMAEDGEAEAAEMLNDPPRVYKAIRCKECAGCLLMAAEKACGCCQGCQQGRGCEEHHRRCVSWPRNANTYHGGSTITAASSQFDLVAGDLSKYEDLINRLQDIDGELEDAMDALPLQSAVRDNPRFLPSAREKDLEDERQHAAKITVMLRRHAELATRLAELDNEEVDDFLGLQPQPPSDPRLTGTQTARALIGMFGEAAENLTSDAGEVLELERAGNAQASLPGESGLFPEDSSDGYVPWNFPAVSEPATCSVVCTTTSPSTTVSWAATASTAPMTFTTESRTRPEASHGGPSRSEVRFAFPPPLPPTLPCVNGLGGTDSLRGGRLPGSRTDDPGRRRSQSNDFGDDTSGATARRVRDERMEARLFELVTWIQTRKDVIATRLIGVEEVQTDQAQPGLVDPTWVNGELEFVTTQLDRTEAAECETWQILGRMQGQNARKRRAEGWRQWFQEVASKMTAIRSRLARRGTVSSEPASTPAHSCQRRGGFLERVKLPTFSGSVEDFGEFKTQFQELCQGEGFTGVIELAQLRQKLPKDAIAMLRGLTTPDEAWARLEETYGNVDLQVLEALKRLRSLKVAKATGA